MAREDLIIIPHVVINPMSICTYSEVHSDRPRVKNRCDFIDTERPVEEQTKFINSTRKSNGTMSIQAKRKISKAIEYIVTTAAEKKVHEKLTGKTVSFRLAFITLTLPSAQVHEDKVIINSCLNSFLNECRQYYQVKNYVWRAERQKNGNLHFHIILDKFVPWYEMRNRWNRIINKLEYVDRFQEKHNHKTPNSTDIHSTRKIKNLRAYLVKYMAKDAEQQENETGSSVKEKFQSGRIWGCNHELSNTRGLNMIIDSEIESELKKVFDNRTIRTYDGTYFKIYYINYHALKQLGSELLFKYFSDYLYNQLGFSEQLKFVA